MTPLLTHPLAECVGECWWVPLRLMMTNVAAGADATQALHQDAVLFQN